MQRSSSSSQAPDGRCEARDSLDRRSRPADLAEKTRACVECQHGRLRLFFLPPYSLDRNPDELVWKHLKADTVGRMTITDKADFESQGRASMRELENDPEKIRSSYQIPSLKYVA